MKHLCEEQLILYRYGEPQGASRQTIEQHLAACSDCRSNYERLQWVLATVSEQPVPERSGEYPDEVWHRLRPRLAKARLDRRLVTGWLGLPRWAAAGAVAALVVAAFVVGRFWPRHPTQAPAPVSAQVRERILLVAVGDHLERSQMVLLELVNTQAKDEVEISSEQRRAEDLLADNRLYRQTAMRVGEPGLANLLDELERVLAEVANSPSEVSARQLESLRRRIEDQGILFKMRVVGTEVERRERRSGKGPASQGPARPPAAAT